MTADTARKSPIVMWAVDAFCDDVALASSACHAAMATFPNASVLPVYSLNLRFGPYGRIRRGRGRNARADAKIRMTALLDSVSLTGSERSRLLAPHVISTRTRLVASQTRKFMRYARKTGARAIAASTHGKSGIRSAPIGSFAGSLLANATMPLLLANGRCASPLRIDKIVFATDLSSSRRQWREILDLARALGAQVDLFYHHAPDGMRTGWGWALGGGWLGIDSFVDQDREREAREADAASWIAEADRAGVRAVAIIEKSRERTADAIVTYARMQTSALLAMVSQSNRLEVALIGSVTRETARAICCPVIAIPSRASAFAAALA